MYARVLGDPTNDPNIYGDPFKTLFVARIVCILLLSILILFMGCCDSCNKMFGLYILLITAETQHRQSRPMGTPQNLGGTME